MPKFGKAIEKIAIKAAENGGPDSQDILTALCASHEDSIDAAKELAAELRKHRDSNELTHAAIMKRIDVDTEATRKVIHDVMNTHMEWTQQNLDRLTTIEMEVHGAGAANLKGPFLQEDRTVWEMLAGWAAAKRIIWIVVGALIVFGISYGADSCSRSHYWGPEAPAIVASPTPSEGP